MEYVQERVRTLHDFGDANPTAPTDRAAVVVPMTGAEHARLVTERAFSTLADVDPEHVYVALRAEPERARAVVDWLDEFDLSATVLWCNAPAIRARLEELGLDGTAGKGRDVWLAMGVAGTHDYVAVHDADATTYSAAHVPRILSPLTGDHAFVKGYYARVEDGRLYGRLVRLFIAPLLRALSGRHDNPVLPYLSAFRYPLAGEFAFTAEAAQRVRAQRAWGLEIGLLGEAYQTLGVERVPERREVGENRVVVSVRECPQ
jgi:glucosyl-3-phosphoglycerate synthase